MNHRQISVHQTMPPRIRNQVALHQVRVHQAKALQAKALQKRVLQVVLLLQINTVHQRQNVHMWDAITI